MTVDRPASTSRRSHGSQNNLREPTSPASILSAADVARRCPTHPCSCEITDESGTIGAIRAAHLGARIVLPGGEIDVYCVDCRGEVPGRYTREVLALAEVPS